MDTLLNTIFVLISIATESEDPCSSGNEAEIADCCKTEAPCSFGQGDCDNDSECEGELICGRNNCGAVFPWTGADCCTIQPGSFPLPK